MSGIFTDGADLRAAGERHGGAPESGRPDDRRVPLTAVAPDGPARGGIVVLHESRVLSDALLDLMRLLAAEGWLAVTPDLFHREAAHSATEVFGEALFADFDATFDWLVARGVYPDCVGVLGFDDAGTAALLVAATRPIGAAVSVAARGIVVRLAADVPALVDAALDLQAPWLGLYGEDDPQTPPEQVDRLRDAVARAPVATNVVTYPGLGHRADEPPRLSSDVEEGDPILDAHRRILGWFDSNLR